MQQHKAFIISHILTWSLICHFLHKVAVIVLFLGKGRPACHSVHFAVLQFPLHAVVIHTEAYAGMRLVMQSRQVTPVKYTLVCQLSHIRLLCVSNLVVCDSSVPLQHLQKLLMFLVILGDLVPVKLQELSGGTQVGQSLLDGGQWGVRFSTRGSSRCTNADSVGWQKVFIGQSGHLCASIHLCLHTKILAKGNNYYFSH